MKKSMIKISAATVAALSLMLFVSGCHRRPLNDETEKLYLALEVDYAIKYDPPYTKPEAYKVIFFDSETEGMVKEEYVSPTGGAISVPPGTYNIIALSMGAEFTKVNAPSLWRDVCAYTDKLHDREFTDNDIVNMPDIIFTGTLEKEVIPERGTDEYVHTVYMQAKTPIETGKVIVRGVKGLNFISSVSAVISNLAKAKVLPADTVISKPVAIPVGLNVDLKSGEISNVFCSFGKLPNEMGCQNTLFLLIEDTAGNKFMKSFDVTDQVYKCDTKDIIIIVDTKIEVLDPTHGGTGSGLTPVVGDWDDIHTTVPVE